MQKFLPNFYQRETNRLHVYFESRSKKHFVGTLVYDVDNKIFIFEYDSDYLRNAQALSLGPDLSLKKKKHQSENLFVSFQDRLPSKENPAYVEYCLAEGISVDETDPIVLLATVGKRGPSSFVIEAPLRLDHTALLAELERFKKQAKISLRDTALYLGTTPLTLQRIYRNEAKSSGYVVKLIVLCLTYPNVALWQLEQTAEKLHANTTKKIIEHFQGKQRT